MISKTVSNRLVSDFTFRWIAGRCSPISLSIFAPGASRSGACKPGSESLGHHVHHHTNGSRRGEGRQHEGCQPGLFFCAEQFENCDESRNDGERYTGSVESNGKETVCEIQGHVSFLFGRLLKQISLQKSAHCRIRFRNGKIPHSNDRFSCHRRCA